MNFLVIILGVVLWVAVMFSPLRPLVRQTIGVIIVIGVMLFFRGPIEHWGLEFAKVPVSDVISGNEFSTRGLFFLKRRLVLAETELSAKSVARQRARRALEEMILDRRVSIEMSSDDRRAPEPWPVHVFVGSMNINQLMVRDGYLLGVGALAEAVSEVGAVKVEPALDETPGSTEAETGAAEQVEAEPAATKSRSMTERIIIWVALGFFGSAGLGMILNHRLFGLVPLLGVASAAICNIIQSWRGGVSIIPPVIALIVIVLMAGTSAKANRIVQEGKNR